ncbi:hypothetical protein ACN38_g13255, partial [Penicillium nordicum]
VKDKGPFKGETGIWGTHVFIEAFDTCVNRAGFVTWPAPNLAHTFLLTLGPPRNPLNSGKN